MITKTLKSAEDLKRERDEEIKLRKNTEKALRNLVAAAERFSKANKAWFESKRPSPKLRIPIPSDAACREADGAWTEMDTAITAAKEALK